MTKEEIFQTIEDAVAAKLDMVTAQQAAYHSAYGRYFQGLTTHSDIPSDGEQLPPDLAGEKPYYQRESWLDMQGLPPEMMSALTCDQYQGAEGDGYVLTAEVAVKGVTYRKAWNFGPEHWRSLDWQEAVEVVAE